MRKSFILICGIAIFTLACSAAAATSTPAPVSIIVSTLTPLPAPTLIPPDATAVGNSGIDCSTAEVVNNTLQFAVNVAEQNVGYTADRFSVRHVTPDCKEALIEVIDEISLYNWGNVYLPVFQSLFGKDTLMWYVIQDGSTGFIVKAKWEDGDNMLKAIVLADTLPNAVNIFIDHHARPK